ncbi:MAG TPA: hypothetical protein VIG45_03315 [Erysipelothrix sp.]
MKKPAYLLLELLTVITILLIIVNDLLVIYPKEKEDVLSLAESGLAYFTSNPQVEHIHKAGYDLYFKTVKPLCYQFTIKKGDKIYYETQVYR